VRLQIPWRGDLDNVDLQLAAAADDLMRAYTGDFTLGSQVANVDLLGESGTRLEGRAGYLQPSDGQVYRVFTITLPIVVNDLWDQAA
jgi:hypothetical protein